MLDENLPTFYFKPTLENPLSTTVYLGQNGDELKPEYTFRRADPKLPASRNCYGVALYDSYNPEVLYAEVLVTPEWTQPTLSQAEIRAQNGASPPPVPVIPNNFTIQLYNPDQQVVIRQIPGSWNSSAHWEFEMPQNSFRLPSVSALDRGQSDPAANATTTKIAFKWKRDGKLSKDISCYLSGKSTDGKRNREPDITVAMFKSGKNLTIYQPNMSRVEVEDVKGLEVVLLLGAVVVKDIFFNASRETFNISSPSTSPNPNARIRKNSGTKPAGTPAIMSGALGNASSANLTSSSRPNPQQRPSSTSNARTQWEIDAETARLKALVESEERERLRLEREEEKRIKKMLEAEEKEQKRKDAEIAKETERLRRQYGVPTTTNFPGPPPQLPHRPALGQPPGGQHHYPMAPAAPYAIPGPVRPVSTGPGNFSMSMPNQGGWGASPPQQQPPVFMGPPTVAQGNSPYMQGPGAGTASSSSIWGNLMGKKRPAKKRSVYF